MRGYQRDTVYDSVLEAEWPAVKARPEARLAAGAAHPGGGATSARVRARVTESEPALARRNPASLLRTSAALARSARRE